MSGNKNWLSTAKASFVGAFKGFGEHDCNRMAAAIAYYTIFSLPAVLVVVVSVTGFFIEPSEIEGKIRQEITQVVGASGAEQIQTMLEHANQPGRGVWGTLVGVGILLFGATGVMVQLQRAFNEVWEVEPSPEANPVKQFMLKRILSLAMLLSIAFLLLVSLVLSTLVSAVGEQLTSLLSIPWSDTGLKVAQWSASLAIFWAMFAVLYRYMPDVRLHWKDVVGGAAVTALLFSLGKWGLAAYLGRSDIASTYGAAGSLALILVWVYYSSMILLFGLEFTRALRREVRGPAPPEKGAVRVHQTIESTTSPRETVTS